MKKRSVIMALLGGLSAMGMLELPKLTPRGKEKPVQSEDEKNEMLRKAQEKRDRKASRKSSN